MAADYTAPDKDLPIAYDYTAPDKDLPQSKAEQLKIVEQQRVQKYKEDTDTKEFIAKVASATPNVDQLYMNVAVFIEGVQVPVNSVTVGYGINTPPTCTIILPAHRILRELPQTTKIHVFFQDMLPDDSGTYQWRLLFDGETASRGYSTTPEGATITLTGIHSTGYMSLMQIITLDVAKFLIYEQGKGDSAALLGGATIPLAIGNNHIDSTIIKNIIEGGTHKSMADIVFQLVRAILENVDSTAVGQYYKAKLGNVANGWKILKRIYGVSDAARGAEIPKVDWKPSVDTTGNDVPPKIVSPDGAKEDTTVSKSSGVGTSKPDVNYVVKKGADVTNVKKETMDNFENVAREYNAKYPNDQLSIVTGFAPANTVGDDLQKAGQALTIQSTGLATNGNGQRAALADIARKYDFNVVNDGYTGQTATNKDQFYIGRK